MALPFQKLIGAMLPLLGLAFISPLMGQENTEDLPSIQTDRPTQGESPNVVPKGLFQTELGFGYGQYAQFTDVNNITLPEALLRYGLGNKVELRASFNSFLSQSIANPSNRSYVLAPVTLGLKIKLREQSEYLPMLGVLGYMSFGRLATSNISSNVVLPSLRVVAQYDWAKFSLLGNLRSDWQADSFGNSINPQPVYVYTLCGTYALNGQLSVYLETFGSFLKGASPNFQTGLIWLIHPQFQVDLSGGITSPFDDTFRYWYVNTGLAFRLSK